MAPRHGQHVLPGVLGGWYWRDREKISVHDSAGKILFDLPPRLAHKEVIRVVEIYDQGVRAGKHQRSTEMRKLLGVKD